MGKSIWDTRFGKRGIAQDERVQVEEGDSWKTIHGAHVLLGDDGRIKAGAGGKFTGSSLELYKQTSKERSEKMYAQVKEATEKSDARIRSAWRHMPEDDPRRNISRSEKLKVLREARMQARMEFLKQHEEANPPRPLERSLSEEEVVNKLAGGDNTYGSCASVAAAYIANQVLGFDVRDFRGGVSQVVGSCSVMDALEEIWESGFDPYEEGGGLVKRQDNESLIENMMYALDTMKPNEPYVVVVGQHMTLVRKVDDREHGEIEYLELQSPIMRSSEKGKTTYEYLLGNGWKTLADDHAMYSDKLDERTKALNGTLKERFGLTDEREWAGDIQGVVPAKRFAETDYMKKLLPYINTSEDKQMKGSGGSIK